MTEYLTGKQNPLLKHVKKLRTNRAYRYEHREFLADGTKLVAEAIKWGAALHAVFLTQGVSVEGIPDTVRTLIVTPAMMKDISRMDTPQGAIAVCGMPEPRSLSVVPGMLALDGIQDPGNLGTILRTADAFDVPVVLTEGCADPYGEKTVRASMGAVLRTPPVQAGREVLIRACKEAGIPICAAALTKHARDLRELSLADCVTVIGSEGQGVCEELQNAADVTAIIPMSERCESLNAAVAAAIVMWQGKIRKER